MTVSIFGRTRPGSLAALVNLAPPPAPGSDQLQAASRYRTMNVTIYGWS
jgi:hypothetical protein